ncbi:MAG: hypothetical protein KZQ64_04445 [gamma proteobacterium symbiont of Bathyaustriella thionipta]|nr:hypothetical protein [gamma proteobacterium symbiont of Bathyaustriella thionipta]MCU7948665.1 hypothetical protein [gamma proteobacterium symbiont of Bathyaustriella thionipta]MCU7952629.1 hypothetical protein [gamma proteobacterium symbiont of Bathyaustriella thionipta]MCU7955126.1 hypothetical protein [gamma proteobacterium symbiont of Bathyaustriella thionipta]MCU7967176.1 hypothetical protein [gamma proteobacterium symbiont of Bathyaustriella thionipta]
MNNRLMSSQAGDELDFVTVSGTPYTAVFDRFSKGHRSKTWIGHLKGYGIQYRVMITLNKNEIEGRISTPEGIMHLKSSKGEVILINYELEGMQKVPFGNDFLLPEYDVPLPVPDQSLYYEPDSINLAAAPSSYNGNTIVDVLVLYNADFISHNNNDALTRIDYLTAVSNQAYIDSQVSMQIRVVAAELIDYSTTPSNEAALDAISDTYNSTLAVDVAALRNQTGADLVIFIRPFKASTHGGCGLANLNKYMSSLHIFATVGDGRDIDWVSGGYSYCTDDAYAHELGHTMGLTHEEAISSTSGSHLYSYGYAPKDPNSNPTNPADQKYLFSTIMAYGNPSTGTPDVFLFSNPDISLCNNLPCGTANANNALSLNNDKDILSGFRDQVVSQTVNLNGVYFLLM